MMDLTETETRCGLDGSGSDLCPMVGFAISGGEFSASESHSCGGRHEIDQ